MNIFKVPSGPYASIDDNYLTAWGFDADTTQFGVRAAKPSETHSLSSDICEPRLVTHSFENDAGVLLLLGNLHIRVPHKANVLASSFAQWLLLPALRQAPLMLLSLVEFSKVEVLLEQLLELCACSALGASTLVLTRTC